jgi:hypothetical protein
MDREIAFALLIATAATMAVGSYYFQGGATHAGHVDPTKVTFAPDDIRYPLQQAEIRAAERKRRASERNALPLEALATQPQATPEADPVPDAVSPDSASAY